MLMTTELYYNKRQIYEEKTKLKKTPVYHLPKRLSAYLMDLMQSES